MDLAVEMTSEDDKSTIASFGVSTIFFSLQLPRVFPRAVARFPVQVMPLRAHMEPNLFFNFYNLSLFWLSGNISHSEG